MGQQNGPLCTIVSFEAFSEVIQRDLHGLDLFSDYR